MDLVVQYKRRLRLYSAAVDLLKEVNLLKKEYLNAQPEHLPKVRERLVTANAKYHDACVAWREFVMKFTNWKEAEDAFYWKTIGRKRPDNRCETL